MHRDSCMVPFKVSFFRNMMPCSLVYKYMHFGEVCTPPIFRVVQEDYLFYPVKHVLDNNCFILF